MTQAQKLSERKAQNGQLMTMRRAADAIQQIQIQDTRYLQKDTYNRYDCHFC